MANSHNHDGIVLHCNMSEDHFIQKRRASEYTTDLKCTCPGISILCFRQNLKRGLFSKRIYEKLSLESSSNM
jgi:hypothetical protein